MGKRATYVLVDERYYVAFKKVEDAAMASLVSPTMERFTKLVRAAQDLYKLPDVCRASEEETCRWLAAEVKKRGGLK
jgi:hypothetical protein